MLGLWLTFMNSPSCFSFFFVLALIQFSAFSIRDLNKISFHLLINRSFILHFYIVPTVLTLSCTEKRMLSFVISLICQRRKVLTAKIRLACTQTLFYFSFRSFRKIGERPSIFFFLHPYPLALAVNKSPSVFIFYHARSTVFEEKIEVL